MQTRESKILLIFDLDNTLVHSRIDFQAIRREVVALLHEAGASDQSFEALRRLSIPELILLAEAHDLRQTGAGGVVPALEPRCWEIVLRYEEAGMRDSTVEPGAAQTLAQLRRRGYRTAVLTNNARPACEAALERFALRPYFELLVTRDEVAYLKPHGDGVERARAHFDGQIERAYVIGDSYIDGLAARRGGADYVAFQADLDELAARGVVPQFSVERLEELLELEL